MIGPVKTMAVLCVLFLLSACDPEQEAAVIADYAERMTEEADGRGETVAAGPTWSVVADCNGAHVVLTGWTGVSDVSPSTGGSYVMVGLGGAPPSAIELDESGNVDRYIAADQGVAQTPAWPWSLVINGEPNLVVSGLADC